MSWTTTGQAAQTKGVKCMIYGNSGAGKTVLTATAPRPVIVSVEKGTLSLSPRNIARIFGEGRPDISYNIPLKEVDTIEALYQACTELLSANMFNDWDTVIFDSASEMAELQLKAEMGKTTNGQRAYGQMAESIASVFRYFRDSLPNKNVVFLAKMGFSADSNLCAPRFPGKILACDSPYILDEVLHLGVGADETGQRFRYLQTDSCNKYYAKDRSGLLDPRGEPAHLGHIFRKISAAS